MDAVSLELVKSYDKDKVSAIISVAHKSWFDIYPNILEEGQTEYMVYKLFTHDAIEKNFKEGSIYVLLKENDLPVGFAEAHPQPENPKTWQLGKIYMLPKSQKKGYGKMLMDEMEEVIKEHEGELVAVNVNRKNPAVDFYRRLGYTMVREENIPFGPFWMNDYKMVKKIA